MSEKRSNPAVRCSVLLDDIVSIKKSPGDAEKGFAGYEEITYRIDGNPQRSGQDAFQCGMLHHVSGNTWSECVPPNLAPADWLKPH